MTTPPPPPPPPGWYPDPSGGSRYWDGSQWGPLTAPSDIPPPHQAAVPKGKTGPFKAVLIAGAVFLLGGACINSLTNTSDKPSSSSSPSLSSSPSSASLPSRSTSTKTVSPEEIERKQASERARLDPSTYKALSPREFALIAKDPDAHIGEKVIVYGVVTQFDAATGTKGFRADTGPEPRAHSYDFDQNSVVVATDPSILADVVEKDFVTIWAEVAGSYSYDTQIGGNTTVPQFRANIIKLAGSTSEPSSKMATPTTSAQTSAAAPTLAGVPPITAPDLGLGIPLSRPACDGTGIVVLGSAYTPGKYREEIQRLLSFNPGSSYLRTDLACPSLRQSVDGNPVYAVYRVAGTKDQVCAILATVPPGAGTYGKWLNSDPDPDNRIECG